MLHPPPASALALAPAPAFVLCPSLAVHQLLLPAGLGRPT